MPFWLSAVIIIAASLLFTTGGLAEAADDAERNAALAQTPFNINTIKRGRALYSIHCMSCHGKEGRGDTEMREFLKTPPADLTDELWFYGGGPVVIFDVIKAGRLERDMPGFADKLSDERIAQIMNYMRYMGGERP